MVFVLAPYWKVRLKRNICMQSKNTFGPHEVIFKEGQSADKMFLVKSGKVACFKGSKDRLIPVFVAKSEDVLGESAMLKKSVYGYSAITLTDVQLVEIPSENFQKVLEDAPDWLVDLTSTMINRFETTANLIADNRLIHSSIIDEE